MPTGRLWIWKPFIWFKISTTNNTHTIITNDYHKHPGVILTLISDATIHMNDSNAACSWQLYKDRYHKRQVTQPLEHQDHSHSYHHKLETFHLTLKDADDNLQFPHGNTQYMDCESTLKSLKKEVYKAGHTMDMDMDSVMSHKQLKEKSKHAVTEK